jgi:hypothetical protein
MAYPPELERRSIILGTCNFWRKFIRGFSTITCSLHDLVKKGIPFEWTEERQAAFTALKHVITTALVLRIPQEDLPPRIETSVDQHGQCYSPLPVP